MKKYNFKILTVIIILTILVTSCAINSKDKAKETEVNDICEDISDIKDESNPIKKDIENGTTISLPENTVKIYGLIDNENLMILIQNSKDLEDSFCLYNINTNILKEIGTGKNLKFNYLSTDRKKILYSTNNSNTSKYRNNYIYDIEKNTTDLISGWYKAIFADYNGRYVLIDDLNKMLDLDTGKLKTSDNNHGTWTYFLDNNCTHPFPNNKLYFVGDHITYEGLNKKFDEKLARHNIGIYSLDTETMTIDEPLLLFPEVICPLDKSPNESYYISQFDFINDGKSIIFSGIYEKHRGLFIYDIDTKEIINVVFSSNISSYTLSNDKTKILYCINETHGNKSMYLAHIDKNTIASQKCLYEEVKLNLSFWWSPDDTFFLVNEKEYSSAPEINEQKFNIIRKILIAK
ncbi:hypothetical protein [Vallitalea guaymasensis]|uniref:hypothetical protein n=1 Tax=Vallitalea guaymasensis TaxID=1185412 RepID=UPI000DE26038|nr:hypothetical protein [Vallitalea guaymasensis]